MRDSLCMLISGVVHAAIIAVVLTRAPLWAADAHPPQTPAWLEVLDPPKPEPVPEPERVPESRPLPKTPPPKPTHQHAPPVTPNPQATGIPDAQGTLDTGIAGEGTIARNTEDIVSNTPSPPSDPTPTPLESHRTPKPAELSLWVDRHAFEHLALVRPGLAIVMSVPGLRELLRGSNIRPFYDLERLRITLTEAKADRLVFAGVHSQGESAVRDAATRIAAMRREEPVWRGSSQLRATSWIDGSGIDRGLALQDGAFLIGARETLPAVLGDAPADDRVQGLSRLRKRVFFLASIEDVARYVPPLRSCALQALRVSMASTAGDAQRVSVRAEYESSEAARNAAVCLAALGPQVESMSRTIAVLSQAVSAPGSFTAQLNIDLRSSQIQFLLDELAWVIRSASRG